MKSKKPRLIEFNSSKKYLEQVWTQIRRKIAEASPYRGEHDGGIGSLNRRPNSENSGEFSSNSPCTVVVSALLARRGGIAAVFLWLE